MNLGQLEEENEKFVNNYKSFGYKTKTQLTNDALKTLRLQKAKDLRQKWLTDAFSEMTDIEPDVAFETIEGDDFVDKSW